MNTNASANASTNEERFVMDHSCESSRDRQHDVGGGIRPLWPLLLVLFAVTAGCATLESMAPPVDAAITQAGQAFKADAGMLATGREVYITDCARCHSVEPISRYTAAEWKHIMPEMAAEAHLSRAETDAVNAYVFAVLTALDAAKAASPDGGSD